MPQGCYLCASSTIAHPPEKKFSVSTCLFPILGRLSVILPFLLSVIESRQNRALNHICVIRRRDLVQLSIICRKTLSYPVPPILSFQWGR
jgi:hypothetical protein